MRGILLISPNLYWECARREWRLMLSSTGKTARAKHYKFHDSDFAAFVAALTAYRYLRNDHVTLPRKLPAQDQI